MEGFITQHELAFWRGIMRDHAVFNREYLGPGEQDLIAQAEKLRRMFEGMPPNCPVEATVQGVTELIAYDRELLRRQLACAVTFHLPPSALLGQIEEGEEFFRTVGILPAPETPFARPVHLHRVWLEDAALHTALAMAELDPREQVLRDELSRFERLLTHLHLKAAQQMMLHQQTGQPFAAARLLTAEALWAVESHIKLWERLEAESARCEIEFKAPPLLFDHFIREERHYLGEVAALTAG